MTIGADPSRYRVDRPVRDPVVLAKPGVVAFASGASPILGTAVAARTADRVVEARAARRDAEQHGELGVTVTAMADIAIATQYVILMHVHERLAPVRRLGERNVGRVPEISVACRTVVEGGFGTPVLRVGLSCSRPDHGSTEQRNEK